MKIEVCEKLRKIASSSWLSSLLSEDIEDPAPEKFKGKFLDKIIIADPNTFEEHSVRVTAKNKITSATLSQIHKAFEADKAAIKRLSPTDAKHLKIGGVTRFMFKDEKDSPEYRLRIYDDRTMRFDPDVYSGHDLSWFESDPKSISWNG